MDERDFLRVMLHFVRTARYHTLKRSIEDRTQESGGNRAYKDMSTKYRIAFSANMKRYPGKLWTVTAQNCNKPGLHTSNIAGAVDGEDLHQILILTLNIYFSLRRFHSSLRRIAVETSFRCDAGSTFPHFQDRRWSHRIMCEQKPHPVWLSAEKPSGLVWTWP